jgi:hypothetical protein
MTIKEELSQEIESTPEGLLVEVLDFLRFIKSRKNSSSAYPQVPPTSPSVWTGRSLLEHLKNIGTWQGEDFEECLRSVYETRSQTKFDNFNPL